MKVSPTVSEPMIVDHVVATVTYKPIRRIYLRVTSATGPVHVSVPRRCPPAQAESCIREQIPWIERQLPVPPQSENAHPDFIPEGAERFPRDLIEAADRLAVSEDAKRLFGAEFVGNFAATCRHEYAALARAVSAEERARYLEG